MIRLAVARFVASGMSWTLHTQERTDVGIVRLRRKRTHEEEHGVDPTGGHASGDLSVAALGSTQQCFDLEPDLLLEQLSGVSRGRQRELGERGLIEGRPGDEVESTFR
jgi:hypothetical protein